MEFLYYKISALVLDRPVLLIHSYCHAILSAVVSFKAGIPQHPV